MTLSRISPTLVILLSATLLSHHHHRRALAESGGASNSGVQGVRQRNSSLPLLQLAERSKSRHTALDLGDLLLISDTMWEVQNAENAREEAEKDASSDKEVGSVSSQEEHRGVEDELVLAQPAISQVNSRLWRASVVAAAAGGNDSLLQPFGGTLFIRASRFRGLGNNPLQLGQTAATGGMEEGGSSASGERKRPGLSVLIATLVIAVVYLLFTIV